MTPSLSHCCVWNLPPRVQAKSSYILVMNRTWQTWLDATSRWIRTMTSAVLYPVLSSPQDIGHTGHSLTDSCEEMNSSGQQTIPSNYFIHLESVSILRSSLKITVLLWRVRVRVHTDRNYEIRNVCCFKLNFTVICYEGILFGIVTYKTDQYVISQRQLGSH